VRISIRSLLPMLLLLCSKAFCSSSTFDWNERVEKRVDGVGGGLVRTSGGREKYPLASHHGTTAGCICGGTIDDWSSSLVSDRSLQVYGL
jgi:hypothetical protein